MISPITMRTVIKPFAFGGYAIPAGSDVMVANGITHFLPEYFPNPNQFDITRDHKNVPPQVYTPFSLGGHTCLGAGVAESLLMLTTAAIVHHADICLDPPHHVAKIRSTPAPNPGKGFIMRVSAR
jgi:cytochrome P450